jgi:hypothetical protein
MMTYALHGTVTVLYLNIRDWEVPSGQNFCGQMNTFSAKYFLRYVELHKTGFETRLSACISIGCLRCCDRDSKLAFRI